MSHFAHINELNIVTQVIVAEQDFINGLANPESWIQTSYNTSGGKHYDADGNEDDGVPLRKNFAGIGYKYDADRDAFIPPKPYASSILNEDTCLWDYPVARPETTEEQMNQGIFYIWDEETYQADNTQGWVLVGGGVE
jgi:hypothetical protein